MGKSLKSASKASSISRNEWLEALNVANEVVNDPDALTVEEIATLVDRSAKTLGAILKKLVAEGKAIRVYKRIPRAQGGTYPVPAYKLLKGAAQKLK